MARGKIKILDKENGCGLISREGDEDVFFRGQDVFGWVSPGHEVSFRLEATEKGPLARFIVDASRASELVGRVMALGVDSRNAYSQFIWRCVALDGVRKELDFVAAAFGSARSKGVATPYAVPVCGCVLTEFSEDARVYVKIVAYSLVFHDPLDLIGDQLRQEIAAARETLLAAVKALDAWLEEQAQPVEGLWSWTRKEGFRPSAEGSSVRRLGKTLFSGGVKGQFLHATGFCPDKKELEKAGVASDAVPAAALAAQEEVWRLELAAKNLQKARVEELAQRAYKLGSAMDEPTLAKCQEALEDLVKAYKAELGLL